MPDKAASVHRIVSNWKMSRYRLPSGSTIDIHVLNCSAFKETPSFRQSTREAAGALKEFGVALSEACERIKAAINMERKP